MSLHHHRHHHHYRHHHHHIRTLKLFSYTMALSTTTTTVGTMCMYRRSLPTCGIHYALFRSHLSIASSFTASRNMLVLSVDPSKTLTVVPSIWHSNCGTLYWSIFLSYEDPSFGACWSVKRSCCCCWHHWGLYSRINKCWTPVLHLLFFQPLTSSTPSPWANTSAYFVDW